MKKGDDGGKAMTYRFGRSDDWTALFDTLLLGRKITLSPGREGGATRSFSLWLY